MHEYFYFILGQTICVRLALSDHQRHKSEGIFPKQEPPEMTVSGEDLRQSEREDAVVSLQPLLKEGPNRRDCGLPNINNRDNS